MKETGASAIKMEGGVEIIESIERILSAGIPVMGHLGLTPQSIHKFGTYVVRATEKDEADKLNQMRVPWPMLAVLQWCLRRSRPSLPVR